MPVEKPPQLAQHRSLVLIEQIVGFSGELEQLLRVDENPPLVVQLVLLAMNGMNGVDLRRLEVQQIQPLQPGLLVVDQPVQLGTSRGNLARQLLNRPQRVPLAVVIVEQLEVVARLQQQAAIVLAVNLQQFITQTPQERRGDKPAGHLGAPAAAGRQFPPNLEAVFQIVPLDALGFKQRPDWTAFRQVKDAFHHGPVLTAADEIR